VGGKILSGEAVEFFVMLLSLRNDRLDFGGSRL